MGSAGAGDAVDASNPKDRRILAIIGAALDNLGDASVYAVSLYAVGRAARIKEVCAGSSAVKHPSDPR